MKICNLHYLGNRRTVIGLCFISLGLRSTVAKIKFVMIIWTTLPRNPPDNFNSVKPLDTYTLDLIHIVK